MKTLLHPSRTPIRQRLTDGVWPSGKATVFGTEDRRFESYHPSHRYFLQQSKQLSGPVARKVPQFLPPLVGAVSSPVFVGLSGLAGR